MIHVYQDNNNIREANGNHGIVFHQQMNRINSLGLGFNVTITGNSDGFKINDDAMKQKGLVVIFVKTDKSVGWQFSVAKPQTYETQKELISELYEDLVYQENKYKHVVCEFYLSRDIELHRLSLNRSFKRGISSYNIDDKTYQKYKNDAQFLSSFIVSNKSPKAQWNGSDTPNEIKEDSERDDYVKWDDHAKWVDKFNEGAKTITCPNCKKKFTQTTYKKKKSLPICPHCGTHVQQKKED